MVNENSTVLIDTPFPNLNLPPCELRVKKVENTTQIFDEVRRRWVALTPEEWVRQHFVHFLIYTKGYPRGLFMVETGLKVKGLRKRTDIAIYNTSGIANVLVECKSYDVELNQKSFDQVFRYSLALKPKYLCLTNGLHHYFCIWDEAINRYQFLVDLPQYEQI